MNYYSLNRQSPTVSFAEAAVKGQAPDKGLYFPEHIPQLPANFIQDIRQYSKDEIGFLVMKPYVAGSLPDDVLQKIVKETVDFEFPLVQVNETNFSLELFHGPTLAFKDVGARFMSRCLGYFNRNNNNHVTVLVATSGDTGGAVAHGFYNVPGVRVVILYPAGKVSTLQEKQLTTLGNNITALEIEGTFDDCQRMVKTAFLDNELQAHSLLTSANSINVARWLPQMFYYLLAYKQLKVTHPEVVFSVPSGNFGNICAGMMAAAMGLPVLHFVASTNVNDTVPRFMQNGKYEPGKATPTLSNAMDVADPSNFVRILELFTNSLPALQKKLTAYSFNDTDTIATMESVWQQHKYMLDPHGAVGYLGLEKYLQDSGTAQSVAGVFLETAHPVKFADTAPADLQAGIVTPDRVKQLYGLEKKSVQLPADYASLKDWLMLQ